MDRKRRYTNAQYLMYYLAFTILYFLNGYYLIHDGYGGAKILGWIDIVLFGVCLLMDLAFLLLIIIDRYITASDKKPRATISIPKDEQKEESKNERTATESDNPNNT